MTKIRLPLGKEFRTGITQLIKGTNTGNDKAFVKAMAAFDHIVGSRTATSMERAAANFYAYFTARSRREAKKTRYGNAKTYTPWWSFAYNRPWNDVDVACVLVGPSSRAFYELIGGALGRTEEAIRVIQRYVHDKPRSRWVESTRRYGRVRQARNIAKKLGIKI